jgi:tRNA/rRNA methyltransferase
MVVAVALIEPQYHINVGHVARLMKNFGLKRLYLVKPHFDRAEAVRYSTHGKDVLACGQTATLQGLRKKFDVLIGTTAIAATSRLNVLREAIGAEQMASIIRDGIGRDFCIVLGRESSGLTNQELAMCDIVVFIDTKTKYKTMNIAHALAILLYEISRVKRKLPEKKKKKKIDFASAQDTDLFLQYLCRVADASNYDLHKRPLLETAMKKMLAKSIPSRKDVMLLVSLLRRSLLAIEREKKRSRHQSRAST